MKDESDSTKRLKAAHDAARLVDEAFDKLYGGVDEHSKRASEYDSDVLEREVHSFVIDKIKEATDLRVSPIITVSAILCNVMISCAKVMGPRNLATVVSSIATDENSIISKFYHEHGMQSLLEAMERKEATKPKPETEEKSPLMSLCVVLVDDIDDAMKSASLYTHLLESKEEGRINYVFTLGFKLTGGQLLDDGLVDPKRVFRVNSNEEFEGVRSNMLAFLRANLNTLPPEIAMEIDKLAVETESHMN